MKTSYILLFLSNHIHNKNLKITRGKEKRNDNNAFCANFNVYTEIIDFDFNLQL